MRRIDKFEDIEFNQDIEAWLEPMSYEQFWEEMGKFECVKASRAHCDDQIAKGHADEALVLSVMKRLAYHDFRQEMNLRYHDAMPIPLNEDSWFPVNGKIMRFKLNDEGED